jgi:hypothetical protein
LLTACGGGQGPSDPAVPQGRAEPASTPAGVPDQTILARGAELSQQSLAAAEQQAAAADASTSSTPLDELPAGQIAPRSAYLSGQIARKAAAVRIPAYRFFNTATGAHFYTTDETERTNVQNNLSPPFSFDGPAFSVASAFSPGLSPVHRFFNTQSGVHFYTISETERASVAATLPQFVYEGVAYHASQVAGLGLTPLYRFFVPSKGFHFYTASATERDNLITNLSATYTYEGVGYHVLASDWRAEKLPHTGVTNALCFQAGSNSLTPCDTDPATDLNPRQDGHRAAINPMSYSRVRLAGVINYPLESCVRDNVTGLVWEGKTASGARAGSNNYTNLGNNAATDASGYVAAVNASNLCGFNDWRLPTRMELLTLVDYGIATSPKLNTTWFPNSAGTGYWAAEGGTNPNGAWIVGFEGTSGRSSEESRSDFFAVRLVRGGPPQGPRFSYSTASYPGDAANNLVNDAWSGLQWRRCEQGRIWNGIACTGTATTFTHEQALAHARQQSGWRLPNVKELASLVDLSASSGARIPTGAFPGALATSFWSSSPSVVGDTSVAWNVNFGSGIVEPYFRSDPLTVRLVRASQ